MKEKEKEKEGERLVFLLLSEMGAE